MKRIFLMMLMLVTFVTCNKDTDGIPDKKNTQTTMIKVVSDSIYFDLETARLNLDGSRSGVWTAPVYFRVTSTTDNYLVAFNGVPRIHVLYNKYTIDSINYKKVSSGTAILNFSNGISVEVANYDIHIYYKNGTIKILPGHLTEYNGEQYSENNLTGGLVHSASPQREVYFEMTRLGAEQYRLPYKPHITVTRYLWNCVVDGQLIHTRHKEPEHFGQNIWAPKHYM